MSDVPSFYPPNNAPIKGSEGEYAVDPRVERANGALLSFDDVQDRLVEAMITCWRDTDRERGWQRLRAHWPEVTREIAAGDYDARGADHTSSDVAIRPASLTRVEVAEMDEAFAWVEALAPEDRKVVGLAVTQLASGKREVSWLKVLRAMGLKRGRDGLRMRYGRAIATIADAQSRGNPRAARVNAEKVHDA